MAASSGAERVSTGRTGGGRARPVSLVGDQFASPKKVIDLVEPTSEATRSMAVGWTRPAVGTPRAGRPFGRTRCRVAAGGGRVEPDSEVRHRPVCATME